VLNSPKRIVGAIKRISKMNIALKVVSQNESKGEWIRDVRNESEG
jgi:hypothetical protein